MQLAKLEGLDSSGKLVEELKADMEKYTGLRDACIKEQTTVENQLIADRAAYPQKKAEYEKAYHQYMQNVPMHTLLGRARRIENFIVKIDPWTVSCKEEAASGGADTSFSNSFPQASCGAYHAG